MSKRNTNETNEHQQLIQMMANHFQNLGYTNIKADLPGYTQPDIIEGTVRNHRPDLTCRKNNVSHTLIILEAETCSTIHDDHTASQWALFRGSANKAGGQFHIVVPKFCSLRSGREKAKERLRELGLWADEIWMPS